jgi:hypothetical protein
MLKGKFVGVVAVLTLATITLSVGIGRAEHACAAGL